MMKIREFQKLPFRKKLNVIKNQTVSIVLGAMLLFLLGSYIHQTYLTDPACMNVEMINACTESPGGESFQPFLQQHGTQTAEQRVEISKIFQLGEESSGMKFDPTKLLICRMGEGKTDLFFWDTDEIEPALVDTALMDLRTVLTPEQIQQYQDRLLFTGPILAGGYPYGLVLKDNAWVRENNYYEDCVVGVAKTAKDLDLVRAFLEYIL